MGGRVYHNRDKLKTLSGIDCYTQHMLKYNELKTRPREFLASTGLKRDEFEQWLPAFRAAYEKKSPPELTQEGTPRQRQFGGGATGAVPEMEDTLFFLLVYHKTHPRQTMPGLPCGMSPPQAHVWLQSPPPDLATRLARLGRSPRARGASSRGEAFGARRRPSSPGGRHSTPPPAPER